MNFNLDLINLALIVTTLANAFLLVMILSNYKSDKKNLVYFINIIFIIFWSVGMIFFRGLLPNILYLKVLYLAPTFIASTFLHFAILYTNKKNLTYIRFIYVINIAIAYLTVFGDRILISSEIVNGEKEKVIYFGDYYILYALYISSFFILGQLILFNRYKNTNNEIESNRIFLIFLGYFTASSIALFTNLLLPWFGFYNFNWMGQVVTLFMVLPVVYAIISYNLFQIKLLATEIFIILLVGVSLFRVFISDGINEIIFNILFTAILTFFGYLLIKSSLKEAQQKDELQKLNKKITYFNEQLKTLDERKTEFINIASHQLRTPATAIKGYTQLISDGDYGEMSDNVRKQVMRINELADQSLRLITDMLNISRIEENRLVYHYEDVDVNDVIYNIAKSFEPRTKEKGLEFTFEISKDKIILKVDKTLFTQAVENVIDNSVKYTKKGGLIHLNSGVKELNIDGELHKVYQFECVDNGIGIDKESQIHLFEKFSRSKNARDSGLDGTGIGMYLAREIIHSHKGEISVTSEGEGKGTRSLITLNIK